jgi:hypothetical protein
MVCSFHGVLRRTLLFSLCSFAAFQGCLLSYDLDGFIGQGVATEAGVGPTPDAPSTTMDAPPLPPPVDAAGVDAADACAPATYLGDFAGTASDGRWFPVRDARFKGGFGELNPEAQVNAGAFWNVESGPVTFADFDLTFEFSIIYTTIYVGDGLAFGWLASNAVPTGCEDGKRLCIMATGVTGYAVVIRTYQGTGEPGTPYIAVANAATFPGTAPAAGTYATVASASVLTNLTGGDAAATPPAASWHKVHVRLTKKTVSVWLDALAVLTNVALPSYTPFKGYWGFGGSTGGNKQRNSIRDVKMTITPPCP